MEQQTYGEWMRSNPLINEKTEFTYYFKNMGKVLITVHSEFLQEPVHIQGKAIRIFIWWAIKHYIKLIFKR
jgi:hypothetical protein